MTDEFFGTLHINHEHMNAVDNVYDNLNFSIAEATIEELSELITAISKWNRYDGLDKYGPNIDNVIEEIAHVIICIRCLCRRYGIFPEEIQAKIIEKDKKLYEYYGND